MKAGIYARLSKEIEKQKLEESLLIFDAAYSAFIGANGKTGFNSMKSWLRNVKSRLRTLSGDKRPLIWDKFKGSFKI